MSRYAIIIKPVVDLRRERVKLTQDFSHDDSRESQLLFGEKIEITDKEGSWYFVKAVEQPRFNKNTNWHPYPGWIFEDEFFMIDEGYQASHVVKNSSTPLFKEPNENSEKFMTLSMGSFLKISQSDGDFLRVDFESNFAWILKNSVKELTSSYDAMALRNQLCFTALRFLKTPYLWGGRGFYQKQSPITGVDCSGLINLLFRSQGHIIPRDAHDQFLLTKKVEKEDLKPADLVFFKKSYEGRIDHVMLYMGRNNVLEAPYTGEKVRLLDMDKRIEDEEYILYGNLVDYLL